MSQALLIAGRSLRNYRERGDTPPEGFPVVRCLFCGEECVVSEQAEGKLKKARAEGAEPCGVVCTPCLLRYVPSIV